MSAHDGSGDDKAAQDQHPDEPPTDENCGGEEQGERNEKDPAATEEENGRKPPAVAERPHHDRDTANGREVPPSRERECARRDALDTLDGAVAAMTITGGVP